MQLHRSFTTEATSTAIHKGGKNITLETLPARLHQFLRGEAVFSCFEFTIHQLWNSPANLHNFNHQEYCLITYFYKDKEVKPAKLSQLKRILCTLKNNFSSDTKL